MISKEIGDLIEKAKRSIDAAKRLYESEHYDFSVSRAYLLLTKDFILSKHSAVIANFGEYFVKTGLLPASLHTYIIEAFKDRQIGDFESVIKISKEQAETHIKMLRSF